MKPLARKQMPASHPLLQVGTYLPPPSPALPHLAGSPAHPLSRELFHASLPCSPFKAPVGPGLGTTQASRLAAWAWCDLGSAHQPLLSLPVPPPSPAPQALYTKGRAAHLHLTHQVCAVSPPQCTPETGVVNAY